VSRLPEIRHGLLLIEIVASIVLLGTLLCGMIIGMSRFRAQEQQLQLQQEAIQVADLALRELTAHPELLATYEHGVALPSHQRMLVKAESWIDLKQRVRFAGQAPEIQPRLLRVQVLNANAPADTPLLSIDVLQEWVWWDPAALVAQETAR